MRGTVITVTSASDHLDGDTSSATALAARPGGDGVTLREAIEATNRTPGTYSVRFADALRGARVAVGSAVPNALRMSGGNVFVIGDIDGDGSPDVTLTRGHANVSWTIEVDSSGNRVHALAFDGVFGSVIVGSGGKTGTTFADNVISALRVVGTFGIALTTQRENTVVPTTEGRNVWRNTRVIGNDITATNDGISLLARSINDTVDGLTIARNTVRFGPGPGAAAGINISPGFRAGARSQRVTNVLIAENVVQGPTTTTGQVVGIWISVGVQGASANAAEVVRMVANRVTVPVWKDSTGIELAVGDGASDDYDKAIQPIIFPEENMIRDVRIDGNSVTGAGRQGIWLFGGCCGGRGNAIRDVVIEGNRVEAHVEAGSDGAVALWAGDSGNFFTRPTEKSVIEKVQILRNTLSYRLPTGRTTGDVSSGAVQLRGGKEATGNTISDVTIAANRIESEVPSITLIAGRGGEGLPTTNNVIRGVTISCDLILRRPTARIAGVAEPRAIMLIGGVGPSTGNSVEATIKDTLVVDRTNEHLAIADVSGASGNSATAR